jgi:hypothetical protein
MQEQTAYPHQYFLHRLWPKTVVLEAVNIEWREWLTTKIGNFLVISSIHRYKQGTALPKNFLIVNWRREGDLNPRGPERPQANWCPLKAHLQACSLPG